MSAGQSAAQRADAKPEPGAFAPAAASPRDLLLAGHTMVQKQNIDFLSHKFGFHASLEAFLASRDNSLATLEDQFADPLNRLPTAKRWVILLRRAIAGNAEARDRIRAAVGWRIAGRRSDAPGPRPIATIDSLVIDQATYAAWVERFDTLSDIDRAAIIAGAASPDLPSVHVLLPLDQAGADRLPDRIAQLTAQHHVRWQASLILATDLAADDPRLTAVIAADARILPASGRPDRGHELVLIVGPDVILRPETLLAFAASKRADPALRLIYADEDRIAPDGTRSKPLFKPGFSPELNRRLPYLGDCVAVSPDLLATHELAAGPVSGWASHAASSLAQDDVAHIARILFHRPDTAPDLPAPTRLPLAPSVPTPSVAIIIPTRNHAKLLEVCIGSIRGVTHYPPDQIFFIVVDNGSSEPDALDLLARLECQPRVTVIRDPSPFNYARLNNRAAHVAVADILLFLNNDTEIADPDWLATLANWAARDDIGVVGPKLLYPDGTVQHAGVVLGIAGVAGHSFVGIAGDSPGYMGLAQVTREAAALTGACIAVRRSVFEAVGGFNEQLEIAFNDTALCSEVLRRGLRNLYVGDTSVIHHESKSRGFDNTPEKLARFRHECQLVRVPYKSLFDDDPFYNPNLGLFRPYQPSIPRAARPWLRDRRRLDPQLRVLILSDVNAIGHGVPVVIKQHAEYLAAAGCTVFVGGTMQPNEISYARCLRVYLDGPGQAQSFAYEADVDVVISHTIPYFTMFRSMGPWPRRVIFDHGEPPPAWFPHDRQERENIDAEKRFCYRVADLVLTNTATVKHEIGYDAAEVAGLGNAHLATWNAEAALRRDAIRARFGFTGKIVVLNVSRFHKPERHYKGIDGTIALKRRLAADDPALAERLLFVLVGKGTAQDRADMQAEGLTVFASVPDETLIDLYIAADLYANFSKWEGFNLGIAQALAMGLEVVASDIPAHRAFPIETSDDDAERARLIADAAHHSETRRRVPVLIPWEPLLEKLHRRLITLCTLDD